MVIVISLVIAMIATWAGWKVWQSLFKKAAIASIPTEAVAPEVSAHQAFIRGNAYLFNGEVDEAIGAFQRALELDPQHPHAAKRLAEAEQCRTVQNQETTVNAA